MEEQAKREKAFEAARKKRLERRAAGGGAAQPAEDIFSKNRKKLDEYYEGIESKYPRVAKNLSFFKEVWDETFPSAAKDLRKK